MATVKILSPIFPAGPVRFLGKEGVYWRLRIKGAALVVVTLGIYRFWLATDARRFLWSNTEIAGETLEYNGLATELLVGFLLAIAIVVPLYTAFAIVALADELAVPFELSTAVERSYRAALERYGAVDGELLAVALLEERAGVRLRRSSAH